MVLNIIILVISICGCVVCSIVVDSDKKKMSNGTIIFINNIFFTFAMAAIMGIVKESGEKQPSAIDVYRNNTELQISKTYTNDSILVKCDSLVVFKK